MAHGVEGGVGKSGVLEHKSGNVSETLQISPKLQSLISQEGVKLRTSNLAGTFTRSIRSKAH